MNASGESEGDTGSGRAWNMIIEEYSKLNLTREMDRLPALLGVAAFRGGKEYLASIWVDHLPGSLYWTSEPSSLAPVRHPQSYRAPSFSWVSVEGPIRYRHKLGMKRKAWDIIPAHIGHIVAHVKSYSATVSGSDP